MVCKCKLYSGPLTATTIEMKVGSCVCLKEVTRRARFWNNFAIEKVEANNQSFNIQGNLWHAKALRSLGWLQGKKTHRSHLFVSCNVWNYFCRIQKKMLRDERVTQHVSQSLFTAYGESVPAVINFLMHRCFCHIKKLISKLFSVLGLTPSVIGVSFTITWIHIFFLKNWLSCRTKMVFSQ